MEDEELGMAVAEALGGQAWADRIAGPSEPPEGKVWAHTVQVCTMCTGGVWRSSRPVDEASFGFPQDWDGGPFTICYGCAELGGLAGSPAYELTIRSAKRNLLLFASLKGSK